MWRCGPPGPGPPAAKHPTAGHPVGAVRFGCDPPYEGEAVPPVARVVDDDVVAVEGRNGSMNGSMPVSDSACAAASALGHPAGDGDLGAAVAGADPPPGAAVAGRALGCKGSAASLPPTCGVVGRRCRASGRSSWPQSGCGVALRGQRARMETFSPASSGAPSGPFLRTTKIIYGVGIQAGCSSNGQCRGTGRRAQVDHAPRIQADFRLRSCFSADQLWDRGEHEL